MPKSASGPELEQELREFNENFIRVLNLIKERNFFIRFQTSCYAGNWDYQRYELEIRPDFVDTQAIFVVTYNDCMPGTYLGVYMEDGEKSESIIPTDENIDAVFTIVEDRYGVPISEITYGKMVRYD